MAPGRPGTSYWRHYPESAVVETFESRELWFATCLDALGKHVDTLDAPVIAFPHGIGCGLAGGDWSHYKKMIEAFALSHPHARVITVRKD